MAAWMPEPRSFRGKPSAVSLTLTGAPWVVRNFKQLSTKTQKLVVRASVKKVARLMVKAVKTTMETESPPPIDSGLLRKSIGFRTWTSTKHGFAVGATIGPKKGFGTMVTRNNKGELRVHTKASIAKVVAAGGSFTRREYADPVKYAHLVEGGRQQGKHGTVQARPFIKHAYLRSHAVLGRFLSEYIQKGIEQEAAKLGKGSGRGR